jgi:leader peptidase (prepilin peptidase) / N-methyltransferase
VLLPLPGWTVVIGFAFGAIVGSFLNVVIYRVPRGMSLGSPKKSFCPSCKHPLGFLDLFPLLSWLFLRGRCRHCGAKVSSRYFFVELLNGAIWAGIWYQQLVLGRDGAQAIAYMLAASTLVAIIFIDWELYIIPDQINAFLWAVGIGLNLWLLYAGRPEAWTWGMPSALAGWITGVGVLWGIAFLGRILFRKDAMGHGDIKMARGIGAVLFPATAMMGFGLAVALGAVLGIVQVLFRKDAGEPAPAVENREIAEPVEEMEEEWEPESLGSLLKCGLGYLLCIDIVGLFVPKLYENWFGEPAYEPFEELEEYPIERTMIPFGPYLALGAIAATVFQAELRGAVDAYVRWSGMSGEVEQSGPREGL